MRVELLLLGISILGQTSAIEKEFQQTKFTGVKCSSSNKSITSYFCSIKAVNRTTTALNFGYDLKKPANNIQILSSLSYKYGTIYREVLKLPAINICELISGAKNHPLAKMFLDLVFDFANFMKSGCPLSLVEVKNLVVDVSKIASIFPMGDYRNNLTFFNDKDSKIFQFVVTTQTTSSLRHSF